ncbi:MAG: cache domain-containing protein, partial [Pseudohongiella sp.]
MSVKPSSSLSFGARLTIWMTGVVLVSVVAVSTLVYVSYRDSFTRVTMNELEVSGSLNVRSFLDWARARQDEMRYLASLDSVRFQDLARTEHLMLQIANAQGFYDTIFFVDMAGFGVVGVEYDGSSGRIMTPDEAQAFAVADRAWFQQASGGDDAFSQPVISRATGNQVSTVAIPVRVDGQVIGVMRGAVRVDTILSRVSELGGGEGSEVYLLDSDARPVTPAQSLRQMDQPVDTVAGNAIA